MESPQDRGTSERRGCGCSLRGLLIGTLLLGCLFALGAWGLQVARESSRRDLCGIYLKQIWLSLSMYENAHRRLPPPSLVDTIGTPLLSWRVLAIEYIWYNYKFRSLMDFSQPWDSPRNAGFLKDFDPFVFRCPSAPRDNPAATDYVAVIGPGTAWSDGRVGKPKRLKEMRTEEFKPPILVVEWPGSGIHWAEPRDVGVEEFLERFRSEDKRPYNHRHRILYVDAAGEVGELPDDTPPETVRKLLIVAEDKAR
jgi:hypothetical protein